MSRKLILLLLPIALTWQSCAMKDKAAATLDDVAVVAGRIKATSDEVVKLKADFDAKVNAAEDRARDAGLNVDGTEADFIDSVKKNPGKSWTAGLGTLALAAFGVWQRNRIARKGNALAAVVDTIDVLPDDKPVTKAQILDEIAKHPRMDVGAKLETTAVKSR